MSRPQLVYDSAIHSTPTAKALQAQREAEEKGTPTVIAQFTAQIVYNRALKQCEETTPNKY